VDTERRYVLLFDGDCGFCRRSVAKWQKWAHRSVDFQPYQAVDLPEQFPETDEAECQRSVVLIDISTRRKWISAAAAFRVLSTNPWLRWLDWIYQKVPFFKPFSEASYQLVARNRPFFSKGSQWLSGDPYPLGQAPTYLWARWFYIRILAVGFIAFFLSLSRQIHGLIGPNGILPANLYLEGIAAKTEGILNRFLLAPSFFWLDSGNLGLNVLVWGGLILSVLLFLDFWPKATLFFCWFFYLSFVTVARNFSGFQSDGLMLESALLAMFLAPSGFRPGLGERSPPSTVVRFLFLYFLFRLMFESGMAKILSGDEAWRSLTAMNDYYENCPFPTWLGWLVQHLPQAFHMATVVFGLFVEVICPFFLLLWRRFRLFAVCAWIMFQIGIALTANYTFLNFNSIALAILLIDDRIIGNLLKWHVPCPFSGQKRTLWRRIAAAPVLILVFYVSSLFFLGGMGVSLQSLPRISFIPVALIQHFRSANRYALFASMTHDRKHIEFEGSADGGKTWKPYRFKWQPQELDGRPRFMAPHLPRFDWNLWFAVLGRFQEHPFVALTAAKLMDGEGSVEKLFKENPFKESPPDRIRFPLYQYHFTDMKTWRNEGEWWRRQRIGYYGPQMVRDIETNQFIRCVHANILTEPI